VIRKPSKRKGGGILNASAVKIVGNYATERRRYSQPYALRQPDGRRGSLSAVFQRPPIRADAIPNGITGNFGPSAASINADGKYVIFAAISSSPAITRRRFQAATYIVKGSITWGSNGHVTGTA